MPRASCRRQDRDPCDAVSATANRRFPFPIPIGPFPISVEKTKNSVIKSTEIPYNDTIGAIVPIWCLYESRWHPVFPVFLLTGSVRTACWCGVWVWFAFRSVPVQNPVPSPVAPDSVPFATSNRFQPLRLSRQACAVYPQTADLEAPDASSTLLYDSSTIKDILVRNCFL